METDYGHILVYGVHRRDDRALRLHQRPPLGAGGGQRGRAHGRRRRALPSRPADDRPVRALRCRQAAARGVVAVEALNGGSRKGENERVHDPDRAARLRRIRRQRRPPRQPDRHLRHRGRRRRARRSTISSRRCRTAATARWTSASRCARRAGGMSDANRALVGQEFDRTTFPPVTAEQIIAYATACGETDRAGPSTARSSPRRRPSRSACAAGTSCRRDLPTNFGRNGFDAGKDIEIGAAVAPGDVPHRHQHRARRLPRRPAAPAP